MGGNQVTPIKKSFYYPKHSYVDFTKSFKKNWENHLSSLEKGNREYQIGVFLIQYSDFAMEMREDIYRDISPDISLNIREAQYFDDYRLSRDRAMLKYIKRFDDRLKYVIFVNHSEVEFISLDHIDDMLKLLPWEFITAARVATAEVNYYTSIKLE